jgi:FkbM family methyltransferase
MPFPSNVVESAARAFCRYRRFPPFKLAGRLSYLLWRAYENRNFDIQTNGEACYLQKMRKMSVGCIFDVGANIGDWTIECSALFPAAKIHAFEVVPSTFERMQAATGNLPNVVRNQFGLSDREGEIQLFVPENADYCATAYAKHLGNAYAEGVGVAKTVTGRVVRGDDYITQQGLEWIDLLKIDVEGMERSVLNGFGKTLSEQKVRLVQFEYNTTNIVSGFLLREAHELFEGHGYQIGKLYPNYVDFRNFHYRHEDFCGPNMIAIRSTDSPLRELLSR